MMKSSEIICRSSGWEPAGVPAKKEGFCAMCGAEIKAGDLEAPLSLGPAFMDDLYLAARGSQVICGWCTPCLGKEALMKTGYGVFSLAGGQMPFRKWGEIAATLANPPEPPFVAVYATANNQHMAWRAPVNFSRDVFYVRVGLRDLKIRRNVVLSAVNDCVLLGKAIDEARGVKTNPERKTLPNPYVSLSPDLKDISHARLKHDVFAMAAVDPNLAAALTRVNDLALGETWALRFLLTTVTA